MERSNSKAFLYIFIGMLTAFGPFITDMYLPTLPSMTEYFQASPSMIQLGLTFSMFGLASGQLFFGPVSDKAGRRRPLTASLILFFASTLGCIFSADIYFFLFFRFVQGIAGAGGIVIARSIAADSFKAEELAKALAAAGAINGIAPVAAPIIGGTFADSIGWRGIFTVLIGVGLVLFVLCVKFKESLNAEKRCQENLFQTFKLFLKVLKRRKFVFFVLQMACAQGILFGNISSSPFIIQEHYGCSPFIFSLCFGFCSLFIGIGSACSALFEKQEDCIKCSCAGMLLGSLAAAAVLQSDSSLIIYEAAVTVLCFAMGMTFTASSALAMENVRDLAGTGSAVLGAVCFAVGGVTAPLLGLGNMMISAGIVFVCSALLSCLFAGFAFKASRA